jgi:hypothetical protein
LPCSFEVLIAVLKPTHEKKSVVGWAAAAGSTMKRAADDYAVDGGRGFGDVYGS